MTDLVSELKNRWFVPVTAGVALLCAAASVAVPRLWCRYVPPQPDGDLVMEQHINNRLTLPALQGHPQAIAAMEDICRRIEKDPAEALRYLRWAGWHPADARLLLRCTAAEAAAHGGDLRYARQWIRRLRVLAHLSGDQELQRTAAKLMTAAGPADDRGGRQK